MADNNNEREIMKGLSDALGMTPLTTIETSMEIIEGEITPTPRELTKEEQQASDDFDISRKNYAKILDTGNIALERILQVASADESARSYEVVATMIKNLAEANKDFLQLHEAKRMLVSDAIQQEEEKAKTVNNNTILVGSAAELLDMIEARKKTNKLKQITQDNNEADKTN